MHFIASLFWHDSFMGEEKDDALTKCWGGGAEQTKNLNCTWRKGVSLNIAKSPFRGKHIFKLRLKCSICCTVNKRAKSLGFRMFQNGFIYCKCLTAPSSQGYTENTIGIKMYTVRCKIDTPYKLGSCMAFIQQVKQYELKCIKMQTKGRENRKFPLGTKMMLVWMPAKSFNGDPENSLDDLKMLKGDASSGTPNLRHLGL